MNRLARLRNALRACAPSLLLALGLAAPATQAATCVNDSFSSGSLDTTLWTVMGSGYTPQVVNVGSPLFPNYRLRLTDSASNRSTFTQLKRWLPAAGNTVTIEFDEYAYGGSGADGVAVVLSDASLTPSHGAVGGSLGYAQITGVNGFGGGWLGVGIDEYGNFPNPTEGRRGYPAGWTAPAGANAAAGAAAYSLAVRGSGSGTSGYALLANTGSLPLVVPTTSSTPTHYRITVDNSGASGVWVKVETQFWGLWTTRIPRFNVMASNSGQAAIPAKFLLSIASSTGGSTNYHELDNVSICATTMLPIGASSTPAGFDCIETGLLSTWSSSARHPLYTQLVGSAFAFDVVALKSDGSIENNMVAAGGAAKSVTVELVDATASAASCAAYGSPVASQTLTFQSGDTGRKTLTTPITLSRAYASLRCRVTDTSSGSTVQGCSSDTFTVRPTAFTAVSAPAALADGSGTSATATPVLAAGSRFTLQADTGTPGYNGTPTLDTSRIEWTGAPAGGRASPGTGTLAGSFSGAAASSSGNGASGSFTYSEAGYFRLKAQALQDLSFTAVSGDAAQGDCTDDDSNTPVNGQVGCRFSLLAASSHFGRFVPAGFSLSSGSVSHRADLSCSPASTFTYTGEPFALGFTLTAVDASGSTTQNYTGSFARLALSTPGTWNVAGISGTTGLPGSGSNARVSVSSASGSWSGGVAAGVRLQLQVSKAGSPEAPLNAALGIAPADADGVAMSSLDLDTSVPSDSVDRRQVASVALRHGRLRLYNAIGASDRALGLPLVAQYWTGSAWSTHTLDSCTRISSSQVSFGNYRKSLTAADTQLASSPAVLNAGSTRLMLSAPTAGHRGTVDLALSLGASATDSSCLQPWTPGTGDAASAGAGLPYLRGDWCGTGTDKDPSARASFGLYRGADALLYAREIY